MISKSVARTDAFLSLPFSAQSLYFQLNLDADDDGFVSNPTAIMRMSRTKQKDLTALINAQYIIDLGDKTFVIRHWYQNNRVRKDRYHPTVHQTSKNLLKIDGDGLYRLQDSKTPNISELLDDERYTDGIPLVCQTATQNREGKVSIVKVSIDEARADSSSSSIPSLDEVKAYCESKNLKIDPLRFWNYNEARDWQINEKPVNWKQNAITWNQTERIKAEPAPRSEPSYGDLGQYDDDNQPWMKYGEE